jgi:glycosyltransferase involved in cell wall biosynthesis
MNPKISVVIPVYNTKSEYIEEAINSVLNQTLKEIEIIVVNDGSTDENTLNYLKTLSNLNLRVINQENKGLGGARNTGIENSNGDYIGFLDSDDWLDNNFYEVLLNLCEENNADIACGTLTRTGLDFQKPMDNFKNNIVTDFVEKMKYITNGSTCSKLFRKELFSNIRFKEHTYYEDNPVLVETLVKSNKVAFTNTVKYYYRENPKSICLNPEKKEKRKNDKLDMLLNICNIISKQEKEEKEAVLRVFVPILVDEEIFCKDKTYQIQIKNLLGNQYNRYLYHNSILERIFSIKNSKDNVHKIITILFIKFKIKRNLRGRAK